MPATKLDTAYAALMSQCNQGTFLYTPDVPARFHPGACGFFDQDGLWGEITDLRNVQKLKSNQYLPPNPAIDLVDPFTCKWNRKVVEKEEGRHAKVSAGVSAAVAAAVPVDASANTKMGSTAEAGAGLVASPNVVRITVNTAADEIIKKWVVDNAENLIARHRSQISENGLWVIVSIWMTEKCEISMWNKTGKTVDLGVDVGMTGIGKVGIGGGRHINAKVDEHVVYSVSMHWFAYTCIFVKMILTLTGCGRLRRLFQRSLL
jgi:hypothetical protein